jgi:hypothetical protein
MNGAATGACIAAAAAFQAARSVALEALALTQHNEVAVPPSVSGCCLPRHYVVS